MSRHEKFDEEPLCISFAAAAIRLGVPKESLRKAADEMGMTIRMGRFVGLCREDLKELIEKCRVEQKAPDSTGGRSQVKRPIGKSEIPAMYASQPALSAAARLKANSRTTSPGKLAQVVPLTPRK
jgi:hypothetical protein